MRCIRLFYNRVVLWLGVDILTDIYYPNKSNLQDAEAVSGTKPEYKNVGRL